MTDYPAWADNPNADKRIRELMLPPELRMPNQAARDLRDAVAGFKALDDTAVTAMKIPTGVDAGSFLETLRVRSNARGQLAFVISELEQQLSPSLAEKARLAGEGLYRLQLRKR